jgi:hypothetical protein
MFKVTLIDDTVRYIHSYEEAVVGPLTVTFVTTANKRVVFVLRNIYGWEEVE